MVNAPIHDLLIRIKNSYMARRKSLDWVQHSQFKVALLTLLQKFKFIKSFDVVWDWPIKTISIILHVTGNRNEDIPVISMFSKPSRRRYIWRKEIKPVAWWRGIWIVSTSKWLMAAHEAKKLKIWWELIAEIY